MEFQTFIESTLVDLYNSAVEAFPQTTKRQHATQPVDISSLKILPFVGMKTLFLKTNAVSENKLYNPIIIFKNINYQSPKYSLKASDGLTYTLKQPSLTENNVLVRCNCPDFRWRFSYYNHLDKSLQGRKPTKYESLGGSPANPSRLPGVCKHLIKMFTEIKNIGLIID